jgi:hypothetical protein
VSVAASYARVRHCMHGADGEDNSLPEALDDRRSTCSTVAALMRCQGGASVT